jgi:endoglucanase
MDRVLLILAAVVGAVGALAIGQDTSTQAALGASRHGRISFTRSHFFVHEYAGYATITIHRTDARREEWIGYGVRQASATNRLDFDVVPSTRVRLSPGQRSYAFRVRVYNRGMHAPGASVHAVAYLYGAYPQPLGHPRHATLTILRDDPLASRNRTNPLGARSAPTNGNVLQNARLYIAGRHSPAGRAARRYMRSNPTWARYLSMIARRPGTRRFWMWNEPHPAKLVSSYLEYTQVHQPGTTVQLSTYNLVHGHCTGSWSDPPSSVRRYRRWINGFANGIGNFHVILYLEMDALITTGCLSRHGVYVRTHDELRWAIDRLERDPHLAVYVDGGAADAARWQREVKLLRAAGVHHAQGFFLNSTHFDWTTKEVRYGQRISRALGGVHFVVNTGTNGRGPLKPAHPGREGNEVLCNPPGRGLGPLSTHTGYRWADAFLWFGLAPGESGGTCRPGAPPIPDFWPAYAVMLARNRVGGVTGPREPLAREGAFRALR